MSKPKPAASPIQILQQQVCEKFGWSLTYGRDEETGCWNADIAMGMNDKDRRHFTTKEKFEHTKSGDKAGKTAVFKMALEGLEEEIKIWEAIPVQELTQVYSGVLSTLEILDSTQGATWKRFWSDPPAVVGIDTEGNQIVPPVLVQIATPDFVILEAPKKGGALSENLQRLLKDDSIIKVFCDNFAHKDKKCLGLDVVKDDEDAFLRPPIVDVESLVMKKMGPVKVPRGLGRLITLVNSSSQVRIAKPKKATDRAKGRFKNIGRFAMIEQGKSKPLRGVQDLSEEEQRYAALDAWCTLQVYERLQQRSLKIREWETQDGLLLYTLCFLDLANLRSSARVNTRWKELCDTAIEERYGTGKAFESREELYGAVRQYYQARMEEMNFSGDIFSHNSDIRSCEAVSMEELGSKYGYPIDKWDVSQVTDFTDVFSGLLHFNEYIGSWDVSSAESMVCMFEFTKRFNQDISNWDTSNVESMGCLFSCATAFNQPLENWNTSNVACTRGMFHGASSFNQSLQGWDTSNVHDMEEMFCEASSFNQSLNGWNTSNVTDMVGMFRNATSFNQPVNHFDTSRVASMEGMFRGATAFNQSLSGWNTSEVKSMQEMFSFAYSFNQPVEAWDTSQVENMSFMFQKAISFNQSVNHFDTSNVQNMMDMFKNATSFNQCLDGWDTQKVTSMENMFYGAESFNQSIDSWDTSNVEDMAAMFREAVRFNQSLNSWDTQKVEDLFQMFFGASSFSHTLDTWDASKIKVAPEMFTGTPLEKTWSVVTPQASTLFDLVARKL